VGVYVDGARVGVTPLRLGDVAAGDHIVRVADPNGRDWEEHVTVTPGTEVRIDVSLPVRGLDQGWFWGVAATAAALGVGGAIAGGCGMSLHSEYEDPATTPARRDQVRDLGQTAFDLADGFFISAGVAAVGALVLGLFTEFGTPEAEAEIDVGPATGGGTDGSLSLRAMP
jgi:hypothetical protein